VNKKLKKRLKEIKKTEKFYQGVESSAQNDQSNLLAQINGIRKEIDVYKHKSRTLEETKEQ